MIANNPARGSLYVVGYVFVPDSLVWSRELGSDVPSRVSLLILQHPC